MLKIFNDRFERALSPCFTLNLPPNDFELSNEEKCSYRNYEKIIKKIVNTKWSLVFNETCLKENIWPTFTNKNLSIYENLTNCRKM